MTAFLLDWVETALPMVAALMLAHLISGFVARGALVTHRTRKLWKVLLGTALMGLATSAALGGVWQIAIVVATAFLFIDCLFLLVVPRAHQGSLVEFLLHQVLQISVLFAAASLWPEALSVGLWSDDVAELRALCVALVGFLLATAFGAPLVASLLHRFPSLPAADDLPGAGLTIGLLERTLAVFFVVTGTLAAIGFLVAAKALFHFGHPHKIGQRALVGTLASAGWAVLTATATLAVLEILTTAP